MVTKYLWTCYTCLDFLYHHIVTLNVNYMLSLYMLIDKHEKCYVEKGQS